MASSLSARTHVEDSFGNLVDMALRNKIHNLDYIGEVYPDDAFSYASANSSVVVDVRTPAEWKSVGIPDLRNTPSKLLTVSWKLSPSFEKNPKFIDELVSEASLEPDTAIFFICKSGGRSLDAALAMTAAGYKYCFNITGGFEGEMNGADQDSQIHSRKRGWKHHNLPWMHG